MEKNIDDMSIQEILDELESIDDVPAEKEKFKDGLDFGIKPTKY